MPRDQFPIVQIRPFVVYRPPGPQVVRLPAPREAYIDVRAFIARCVRLVSAERVVQLNIEREKAPACDRCSEAGLARLVSLAASRFGEPPVSYSAPPERAYWAWGLATERAYDVLDFLDDPAGERCTHVRVNGLVHWTFFLRDLSSRKVLPYQERKFRPSWPVLSWLTLTLQARSEAELFLVLPFEPNDTLRQYIAALESEAPVRFNPAYFDYFVPRTGSQRFERRRLPPDWLTAGNDEDLGAAISSDPAEWRASAKDESDIGAVRHNNHPPASLLSQIGDALRTHRDQVVVVSGSRIDLERIIECAADPVGLRVVSIYCPSLHVEGVEPAIADALTNLHGERGLILLSALNRAQQHVRPALDTLVSTRRLGTITLPSAVRLAATNYVRPNPAAAASIALHDRARAEGFLSDEALHAAGSALYQRLCADVSVSFI